MKAIVRRSFFFIALFTVLVVSILFTLLGFPTAETWGFLWQDVIAGFPYGLWLIVLILFLSCGIALWSESIGRSRISEIEAMLQALLRNEDESVIKTAQMKTLPENVSNSFLKVQKLLESQRKSLARISNEKAETEEQRIQEQLVIERQRLARELHDSVSQQLFAASMMLSAMTEQEDAPPTLLQTEKVVQQAQLEMRALLLHLRPVALHDKSLCDGLTELLNELKEKVSFTIEHRLEDVPLPKGA